MLRLFAIHVMITDYSPEFKGLSLVCLLLASGVCCRQALGCHFPLGFCPCMEHSSPRRMAYSPRSSLPSASECVHMEFPLLRNQLLYPLLSSPTPRPFHLAVSIRFHGEILFVSQPVTAPYTCLTCSVLIHRQPYTNTQSCIFHFKYLA